MAAVSFAAYPPPRAAERLAVLLRLCLSVPAGRRDGVRRRARALRARQRGPKGPGAGQLPSSRAARTGRDGRGLARTSSPAGEAGRDQAHSSAGRAVDPRIRSRESVRARGASDREPALTAHREPLRLRHRRRWDFLLRDGAPRRAGRRADREQVRSDAGRARDSRDPPGVSFALRSGIDLAGTPRHQAGQHRLVPLRRRLRLRESAGLRHRQSDSRARHMPKRRRRSRLSPPSTSCAVRRRSSLPSRRSGDGLWITVPIFMGPAASRTGCSRVSSSSPATRRCSFSSSTRRRCRSRHPHGRNCRFRKNSMRSCSRAWPRTRRTGRRPRANWRAGSRPCLSRRSGPGTRTGMVGNASARAHSYGSSRRADGRQPSRREIGIKCDGSF